GLIINGKIYRGCGRGAAEIGHLRFKAYFVKDSESISTSPEILEQLASGWGIADAAQRCLDRETPIHSLLYSKVQNLKGSLTAKDVATAARQGDAFAESILNSAVGYLADAICHVIVLLCPRRIVIGGGV